MSLIGYRYFNLPVCLHRKALRHNSSYNSGCTNASLMIPAPYGVSFIAYGYIKRYTCDDGTRLNYMYSGRGIGEVHSRDIDTGIAEELFMTIQNDSKLQAILKLKT